MENTTLDLSADTIDIRDIIERYEELESVLPEDRHSEEIDPEFIELERILADLQGNGGDEQWRGDWYPLMLIRDSYFTEYAEDMVKDCDGLPREIPSYIEIDWEATAENLKVDYSDINIDGETYWYR